MESDKADRLEQEAYMKTITADYRIKKKKYLALKLPKYLLMSNLDLD